MHFGTSVPKDGWTTEGVSARGTSPPKQGRSGTVSGESGSTADALLRESRGEWRSRTGAGSLCSAPGTRQGTSEIGP
jgi:hypothetical protein